MLWKLIEKAFGTFIGFFIFANIFGAWTFLETYPEIYFLGSLILYLIIMLYEANDFLNSEISNTKNIYEAKLNEANNIISQTIQDRDVYKNSLKEKNSRFPTLIGIIEEYEQAQDKLTEDYLKYKKHPSLKGSEVVRDEARRRRMAEVELKRNKLLTEYYESIAPFLLELKEDLEIPDEDVLEEYSEEEQQDFVTKYISKEEYRKLPSAERNQIALDRFWKRPNKSNWLIGLLYERYVGYLFEQKGYDVNYHGASEGRQDLGRDLICQKKDEILIVQCKYWSQFKTIHEKHIFQLFGTTFQYKYNLEKENKDKKVKAIFCTSTTLSDVARQFAKELEIEVRENVKLDRNYPCIKCNIGRTSEEKIYHLPFDQQYDKVKIEPEKNEFYCATVQGAEEAGFRRAYRYKGVEKK